MTQCLSDPDFTRLVDGSTALEHEGRVTRHIAGCKGCARRLREQTDARFADRTPDVGPPIALRTELHPGDRVGRYVVVGPLGRGGMGEVYCANDPQLNRNIALKLVREGQSDRQQERLLDEARAMALLSHPNVVTVHDVGTIDGRAFIAMELVEGATLGAWVRKAPRSWREIVNIFASAGDGLAAAHRAGVVHRDFKPSNVLVDEHNNARVTDFGIAHGAAATLGPKEDKGKRRQETDTSADADADADADPWAEDDVPVGTPAYMSPEQHRQQPTTERSDQFSFCVALYEALYRSHPFRGAKRGALAAAVLAGEVRVPTTIRIPRALFRIVERGLHVSPEARYPSMDALLAQLRSIVSRARKRVTWALAGVLLTTAGAIGWAAQAPPSVTRASCDGGDALVAQVWNANVSKSILSAFDATGLPYASATATRVGASLGAFATRFAAEHRQACEATRVHGTQADEVLTLRMACLNGRLADLGALLEILANADSDVIDKATQAILPFSDLRGCEESRVVEDRVAPPQTDQAHRVQAATVRWRRANMLLAAGKWNEARSEFEQLVSVADEIHYALLTNKVHAGLAMVALNLGDGVVAEAAAERAMLAAHTAGDRRAAVRATTLLAQIIGVIHPKRMDEALRWTLQAGAMLDALHLVPNLRAEVARTRASIFQFNERHDKALAHYDHAITLMESMPTPAVTPLGEMYTQRGVALAALGRFDEATQAHLDALARLTTALGDTHPRLIPPLHALAVAYARQGDDSRAAQTYERGCMLTQRLLGPENYKFAVCLTNWSISLQHLGKLERATVVLERATKIFSLAAGDGSIVVAIGLNNLGEILGSQGRFDEAESRLSEAHDILVLELGASHPSVASNLMSWGRVQCDRGQCAKALPGFVRALGIQQGALGDEHFELGETLVGLSRAQLATGQVAPALASARRALAIADNDGKRLLTRGRARVALARALWASGREQSLALATAQEARTLLRTANSESEQDSRELDELDARIARWMGPSADPAQ